MADILDNFSCIACVVCEHMNTKINVNFKPMAAAIVQARIVCQSTDLAFVSHPYNVSASTKVGSLIFCLSTCLICLYIN